MTWRPGDAGELPGALDIIDQRLLPAVAERLVLTTVQGTWDAIKTLAVRGAPAIGCASAYGVVVGAQTAFGASTAEAAAAARAAADHLATSRPTAVNLFWALDRMKDTIARAVESCEDGAALCAVLLDEAKAIHQADVETCRQIGKHGAALLPNPARVLTHCNAGGLATAGYGTALGCFYAAKEAGMDISVMACETRPLLQGARLTTYELQQGGVPVTLMSDGMAAFAMQNGKLDAVIVGADRIARNGDAANKIGTYSHAVNAKHHGIPFYVAAPKSTFDLSLASGQEIPIEERAREELSEFNGRQIAPEGVPTWNPAFDVTPAALIAGIITEFGVIQPVTEANVLAVLGEA
ncbi:MAG: S-methyl-5-thioribose-1-phosphate isomerase [Planctomycetes bacterium]|nr:S-methyl-5-thioribose-1-phosphate isomerase [Planctomycetota bacterium]